MTIERCDKSTPGFVCLKFAGHSGACDCVTTQQFDEAMKLVEGHFLYGTAQPDGATTVVGINMRGGDTLETAQPEGATHVWDTGVIGRYPYLKVDGGGVAVWQLQNGGFWQWIGNTLDDISGVVQPLGVSPKRGPIEQAFQNINTAVNDLRTAFVAAIMADTPALADPADELGKVWDVLHAAGINSGGELSTSEGVKLLADKVVQIKVLLNSNYGRGDIGRFVQDVPKPMCDHDWVYVESLNKKCCTKCEATRSAT